MSRFSIPPQPLIPSCSYAIQPLPSLRNFPAVAAAGLESSTLKRTTSGFSVIKQHVRKRFSMDGQGWENDASRLLLGSKAKI